MTKKWKLAVTVTAVATISLFAWGVWAVTTYAIGNNLATSAGIGILEGALRGVQ